MGKGKKAGAAIFVVIILVAVYYFVFIMEEAVEIERAPDFQFYDSEEFIEQDQPPERSISDFRGSIILLSFIDLNNVNTTAQDNVTGRILADYPEVIGITIDIHGPGKSVTALNTYKSDHNYSWYFTFDDNTITDLYDIINSPSVVIIDTNGYGTFKADDGVDYEELNGQLEKVISGKGTRINVGRLPGQKKAPDFSIKDIDGNAIRRDDFKGKILLLDFMSLTCTSCKEAEEVLVKIYDKFENGEVKLDIVSIDIDPTDSEDAIRDHWGNEGIKWSVARDKGDMTLKYHVIDIVHIVLLDKQGYVVYEYVGEPDENVLAKKIIDAWEGKLERIEVEELSTFALAILTGVVTYFSPCAFPMLPGYMSYYLQKDIEMQMKAESSETDTDGKKKKKKGVFHRAFIGGSVAAFGIILVFTIICVLVLLAGEAIRQDIKENNENLQFLVGVIIAVLGALMLTNLQYHKIIQPFQKLYQGIISRIRKKPEGEDATPTVSADTTSDSYYKGLFTYGVGYGSAAAACTVPVFIGLVIRTVLLPMVEGALVFTLYIMSMVVLMIGVTVAIAVIGQGAVQKLAAYTGHIKKGSGIILIIVGIYFVLRYLGFI